MMRMLLASLALVVVAGCGGGSEDYAEEASSEQPVLIEVEAPEPLPVPEPVPVASDTDWKARVHNKNIEIIQVINIINPVAVYITEGFAQYSNKFSDTLNEEWEDTQVQLTQALTLYDDCKARMAKEAYDKELFLDMEEVWQLLVKTGVAGVRTKSMVDSELQRALG